MDRRLNDREWRAFLPGECPLAGQVLPYAVLLHDQLVGSVVSVHAGKISGIGVYDRYMYVCAVVVFTMASSIATNDMEWLDDEELVECLRALETGEKDGRTGTRFLQEQCTSLMKRINSAEVSLACSRSIGGRAAVPVEGWTNPVVRMMSAAVDSCGVQTLKDVFYMVTGWRTEEDRVRAEDKCGAVAVVAAASSGLQARQVISWRWWCAQTESLECVGCMHLTGLLPVVEEAITENVLSQM